MSSTGVIDRAEVTAARDDADAMAKARQHPDGSSVEVWHEARYVGEVSRPETGPARCPLRSKPH